MKKERKKEATSQNAVRLVANDHDAMLEEISRREQLEHEEEVEDEESEAESGDEDSSEEEEEDEDA